MARQRGTPEESSGVPARQALRLDLDVQKKREIARSCIDFARFVHYTEGERHVSLSQEEGKEA